MTMSPSAEGIHPPTQPGRVARDSIADLERPAPTYELKEPAKEDRDTKVATLKIPSDDEAIRERVRAFSTRTVSVYSQPTTPTRPSDIFTNR